MGKKITLSLIKADVGGWMRGSHHGPFEPHCLPLEEVEYTTMPEVMEKLKDRFIKTSGLIEREEAAASHTKS